MSISSAVDNPNLSITSSSHSSSSKSKERPENLLFAHFASFARELALCDEAHSQIVIQKKRLDGITHGQTWVYEENLNLLDECQVTICDVVQEATRHSSTKCKTLLCHHLIHDIVPRYYPISVHPIITRTYREKVDQGTAFPKIAGRGVTSLDKLDAMRNRMEENNPYVDCRLLMKDLRGVRIPTAHLPSSHVPSSHGPRMIDATIPTEAMISLYPSKSNPDEGSFVVFNSQTDEAYELLCFSGNTTLNFYSKGINRWVNDLRHTGLSPLGQAQQFTSFTMTVLNHYKAQLDVIANETRLLPDLADIIQNYCLPLFKK